MKNHMQHRGRSAWALALATLLSLLLSGQALAATTDIANSPLVVDSQNSVKANVFFILDDSGSMDSDFMPDHVNTSLCRSAGATSTSSGGFGSRCCQGSSGVCWSGSAPFGSNRGLPPFLASSFNGMAYNPATRYLPPVDATGTDYPSQTAANTATWTSVRNDYFQIQNTGTINLMTQYPDTEWCTGGTYTDCLRNGNYALPGNVNNKDYTTFHATTASGSGFITIGSPDASTLQARDFAPHYYKINPGEYCTSETLRNCQTTADVTYFVPSYVRWCNSSGNASAATPAANSCQAVRTSTYSVPRYPTRFFTAGAAGTSAAPAVAAKATFTVAVSGCNSNNGRTAGVGSLTLGGVDLLGGTATSQVGNANNLATAIRAGINNGNSGYSASGSNANVTLTAPLSKGNFTATASLTRTSNSHSACTFTPTSVSLVFTGYTAEVLATPATNGTFPGSFERVDIVSGKTYPKASGRADCASDSCSYAEEMTNFANWWTYYHSRMQSMKSSASRAFAAVSDNRRVGYMSINNSTGSDFLNLETFDSTHKGKWFSKLFKARPNSSTPLRTALSRAGRMYGGKLNGTNFNGSTVKDPVLYSCQKNFTILSTDGYWNESNNPTDLDGAAIGNRDNSADRPLFDGGGSDTRYSNTLADTAYYYNQTDLRTGTTGAGLCVSGTSAEDVCGNSTDSAQADEVQNMRTFTLGLGASGYMQFNSKYLSATSGDYFAVKQGSPPNTANGICTWQTSGSNCNWPMPENNTLTTIDDLWHAAINGDGTYFSASDPSELYTGLTGALNAISGKIGAAAAATTSNPNVVEGDNGAYLSYFKSSEWWGELENRTIDTETGEVSTDDPIWSASPLLDAVAPEARKIYMFSSSEATKLKPFTWDSLSAPEKTYFSLSHITTSGRALSQFCSFGTYCLDSTVQSNAAGEPLLSFLRGDRSNEGEISETAKYFRPRTHVLGDIVNSEAVYLQGADFSYVDAGYLSFKESDAISKRTKMVYVGANDGMLHAFNAETGAEVWAYIPTLVLPHLYHLADKEYASNHRYYVDATPAVQDVKIGTEWRTILVGGLGAGGRGYYALDVTDPANPKALWEFSDDNLGYTFGKPEIGKLSNGTWAVFFGSGYNNVSTGDGVGRLYVVDAATGSPLISGSDGKPGIKTSAGSTDTPSGLAHIRGWVDDSDVDNTILRVYSGDNLGNVWRFDVNNILGGAGYEAQRLATLKSSADSGSLAQPITSRPELGLVGTIPVVFVGTGRYLGNSDLTDKTPQSIYAIKDRLTTEDFGNPRDATNDFVKQTLVADESGKTRTTENAQSVDLSANNGWYVDLLFEYERINTDPQLALGTLAVNSNVIETGNVCKVGGSSWANYLDYRTGAVLSSVFLGDAIATRAVLIKLSNNKVISINRLSNNETVETSVPVSTTVGTTRRTSWRDLIQN